MFPIKLPSKKIINIHPSIDKWGACYNNAHSNEEGGRFE